MNPRETLPEGQKHKRRPTTYKQLADLNASITKALEAPAKERKLLSDARGVRVAPGIFDNRRANEIMQRDMDALVPKDAPNNVQTKTEPVTITETNQEKIMEPTFDKKTNPVDQPTIKDWQKEVIETYNGKVLDAELVPANDGGQTTIKDWQKEVIETYKGKVLDAELVRSQKGLEAAKSDVEARNEKVKVPFGIIGKVAEAYKNYPLSLKLTIVAALAVSGIGAGIMGAAALAGTAGAIGIGMRVGAGALTFVGVEKWLKASHEKNTGKERGVGVGVRHTAEAAALAIVIGAFVPTIVRHGLEATGVSDAILDKIIKYGPEVAPMETPAIIAPVEYIKEVGAGDSVWKIAAGIVAEKFPNLSAEQQTYFTDAIKDKIVAYPESFGIGGSDASKLAVGERIDFGGILQDEEFMDKTLASAQNIGAEGVDNIQNHNAEIPAGTPEDTDTRDQAIPHTGQEMEDLLKTATVTPLGEAVVDVPGTPPNLTAEGPSVGQEAGNANAIVEAGSLKGAFQYGSNGAVTGFSINGTLEYPQTLETQKLLNPNWRAGLSSLDSSTVQMNANTVYSYEQLLHSLEQKGAGSSPEATFLREGMDRLITGTEKVSGDVFNGNVAYPPEPSSHINLPINPEAMAQINADATKATDSWIKEVFGKAGWFGFGTNDGKEIFENFANESVDSIVDRKASIPSVDMDKVINMIEDAKKETGVSWRSGEAVEDYLHRAAVADIQNYNKTK